MQPLSYISAYTHRPKSAGSRLHPVSINLITNFTDDVLERILGGMCLNEGLYPVITKAPYKQYGIALNDRTSPIYRSKPDISFVIFDASAHHQSEFLSAEHRDDTLSAINAYAGAVGGHTVVGLFSLPYRGAYGHFFSEEPLFVALSDFNHKIKRLAQTNPALHVFDANKVMHRIGEEQARDPRGQCAFDMPFTSEFLAALCAEWMAYVRAGLGLSRKCIVLDLDNTLWGGVVGEEGPLGVTLGKEYPGVAYQHFQRALLSLWECGVILAINSKNNEADVREVFEKNPHMVLKEEHFAAVRANWDDKSTNIKSLAEELNIGLESVVFIDDSPLERERMRQEVPEVLTPDWSVEPEEYIQKLLALNVFHQMSFTEEDKKKGKMYAEEARRKKVAKTAGSVEEYIKKLRIKIQVAEGDRVAIARASQLTQKTNQYNLTTKRYSEADIAALIKKGVLVATGEVSDVFGGYGIVLLAIMEVHGKEASLDTFLMSCRVMGRGVEQAFFEHLLGRLRTRGVSTITACFVASAKNKPAEGFLPAMGFKKTGVKLNERRYMLALGPVAKKLTSRKGKSILVLSS